MKSSQTTVGSLVDFGIADIQTGPFGTQLKASEYVSDGVEVINVRNIGYGELRGDKLEHVTEATAERLNVHRLEERDIVFGRKGAVDRHLYVQPDQVGWVQGSDCIRLRLSGAVINQRYLSYAFLREHHKQWMLTQCGNKATMASLNQDVIKRICFPLLARSEQDRIAGILSAYDDLISNNARRIALLDKSARLLFEEWFVRLRYPGHEHDRIVRGVPEGWCRKALGEIAKTNVENFSSKNLPTQIVYIDIASVKEGRILSKTALANEEAPGRARRRAKSGDVIWSNVRPNLRQFALVLDPGELDVFSTGFTILTSTSVPWSFLYLVVTSEFFVAYLVNQTTGVSYPAVRPNDFERAEILVASGQILAEFHAYCEPLFRLSHMLAQENEKLARARDLLLPRLMDGRIEV